MRSLEQIVDAVTRLGTRYAGWSVRLVESESTQLQVRRDVFEPVRVDQSRGVMVEVASEQGTSAYCATADLSDTGLEQALRIAGEWAQSIADRSLTATSAAKTHATIRYTSPTVQPWHETPLEDHIELLKRLSRHLGPSPSGAAKSNAAIVDWSVSLEAGERRTSIVSSDGQDARQALSFVSPSMRVTANDGWQTQSRTFGGGDLARQGGLEQLSDLDFETQTDRIRGEVLQLLEAPDCPDTVTDLLIMPSQMMLQIHESIGHPLELDRILGDERNYAGTSFVTPEMFGTYQYGSPLLNVTFDPGIGNQLATYAFDDTGEVATADYLIKDGVLVRGLGGRLSQSRSGLPGVASTRATDWTRAPIDRMGNLNVVPGSTPFDELLASIENGLLVDTNRSWSIDDSRNKFQFGCEFARRIEDGVLKEVRRNPNYRGISERFWRSLRGVGDRHTFQILGTPYCGKGEPNQVIQVGHASPACVFESVQVFGAQ